MRGRQLVATLLVVAAACSSDSSSSDVVGPALDAANCPSPHILFLNRDETMFRPGLNNSRANTATVIATDSATLAAFPLGDELWNEVVSRVESKFAPFNVEVTDQEPESGSHIEVVITGDTGAGLGLDGTGWEWIAPSGCDPNPNGVGFVFTPGVVENRGENPEALAYSAAHVAARAMAPVSYVIASGHVMRWGWDGTESMFLDETVQCGAGEPSQCECSPAGVTAMNSYSVLATFVGPACSETP